MCSFLAQAQTSGPLYRIIRNDPSEILVHISLPPYQKNAVIVNGKTCYEISMPNATELLEEGAPAVCSYGGSFVIPEFVETRLKVVSAKYQLENDVELVPSKGNLYRTVDPSAIPYKYGAVFGQNQYYPTANAVLEEQYKLRALYGQRFMLYPIQYNPVTKTIRHCTEMVISIDMEIGKKNVHDLLSKMSENSQEFIEIYKDQFLNYRNSSYEKTIKSQIIAEVGPMLILCHKPFMAAMKPFVDWKKQLGMKVKLVDVAVAGSTPEAIKKYIGEAYNKEKIAFVLLVGDAPQIPTMKLKSGPSDNGYTYQEGADSYPELIIGRFSAETIADVETQVNRSVNYEKNFAKNKSWRLKGICVASSEGPGDNNERDWQHERKIRALLMNFKYISVSELYDGDQNGQDQAGNPSDFDLATEINSGAGIINYTGHGSATSFGTTGFDNKDIKALTNYDKLPFIFSVACVNGQFTRTAGPCFAETWLRSTKNGKDIGAVATIMSTINQSWNPPMYGQDEMDSILTESFNGNIKRTFGGVTFNAMVKMNDRYGKEGAEMTDTWTIFGDPSLKIMDGNTSTALSDISKIIPGELKLIAKLSPNPAAGMTQLTIENIGQHTKAHVKIYKQSGELVKVFVLAEGVCNFAFSVNDMQPGLYTVQVTDSERSTSTFLVVQ
jgi:hypothetical protein